ncbi:MAG: hypothetical protein LBU50_06605 [Cellulomonas sp.]|jgi:hypothetical protein|nr:hypothetical protein [Cellulomonas sp.]
MPYILAVPLIASEESELVWPTWAILGIYVMVVANLVGVPLLQMQAGKRTHWVFAYWPLLYLGFANVYMYSLAAVQTGHMRVIVLAIITIVMVPTLWIVTLMTKGLVLLRRMTILRHRNPGSEISFVRLDIAADDRARLQELRLVRPDRPISDHVFLVVRPEGVETVDPSHQLERCFLVPWSQVLGSHTSGEVYDGSEFREASLEDALACRENNSRVAFLCTVLVAPDASFSLRFSDKDAGSIAPMISDLINTRVAETESGTPLVTDETSGTSEYF